MTSEELEALIDTKSEELRLHDKKTTDVWAMIDTDVSMDDLCDREDYRDSLQQELADLHVQLGMAYRLEMLDEDCDKDHSLILSTVYNC